MSWRCKSTEVDASAMRMAGSASYQANSSYKTKTSQYGVAQCSKLWTPCKSCR